MMWDGGWAAPLWIAFASLMTVGFWVIVVVVVVALVRRRPGHGPTGARTRAVDLLEERYARGETTREDFLERRAILRGDAGSGGEPG